MCWSLITGANAAQPWQGGLGAARCLPLGARLGKAAVPDALRFCQKTPTLLPFKGQDQPIRSCRLFSAASASRNDFVWDEAAIHVFDGERHVLAKADVQPFSERRA